MAGIIFCDSFDHYTTVTDKWNQAFDGNPGGSGTTGIDIGAFGRAGTNGLRLRWTHSDSTLRTVRTYGSALSTVYIGFAMKTSQLPTSGDQAFFCLYDGGTTQVTFLVRGDGTMQVKRGGFTGTLLGTTGFGIQANTYYYIEAKVTISTTVGVVELRVNETTVLNLTSQNTDSAASGITTSFGLIYENTQANTDFSDQNTVYDDVVVRDDQFPGDVQVKALLPSGAGANTAWTPSAGANYTTVDESAPNSDTDYISTTTLNQKDSYAYPNIASTGSVHCVAAHYWVKKTDSGSSKIAPLVRHSGTDYFGSDLPLAGSDYSYASGYMMNNPGTSNPWTPSDVNNAEFGVKKTA